MKEKLHPKVQKTINVEKSKEIFKARRCHPREFCKIASLGTYLVDNGTYAIGYIWNNLLSGISTLKTRCS